MKLKYHNKNKEEYLIKIIIIVIIKDFYEKWFRNGDYSYIVLTNKGNISNNSNSKTNYEKIENSQIKFKKNINNNLNEEEDLCPLEH